MSITIIAIFKMVNIDHRQRDRMPSPLHFHQITVEEPHILERRQGVCAGGGNQTVQIRNEVLHHKNRPIFQSQQNQTDQQHKPFIQYHVIGKDDGRNKRNGYQDQQLRQIVHSVPNKLHYHRQDDGQHYADNQVHLGSLAVAPKKSDDPQQQNARTGYSPIHMLCGKTKQQHPEIISDPKDNRGKTQ